MRKKLAGLIPLVFVSVFLFACAKSSGVNENKPLSEVISEAKQMSTEKLKAVIADYEKAIESKKAEFQQLTEKIKAIPIAEMMSQEAKDLKADIDKVGSSIKALTERLNVYMQELKKK